MWWRAAVAWLALACCAASVCAQEPARRGAGRGRFVFVLEPRLDGEALRLEMLAARAWDGWREPLGLPYSWPTDLTVRLVDTRDWTLANEPDRRVIVGADGVVYGWIRVGDGAESAAARDRRWLIALAEAAWLRQAVDSGAAKGPVPAWLAAGAAEQALIGPAGHGAMRDARRRALEGQAWQPRLAAAWALPASALGPEARGETYATAVALWGWLRGEAGRDRAAWSRLAGAALAGEGVERALAAGFGPRFEGAAARELELLWQTEAAGEARARPAHEWLSAEESRRYFQEADRFALRDGGKADASAREGAGERRDRVVALGDGWAERDDPMLKQARAGRAAQLAALFGRIHPFYRNAAGSLGRTWLAMDGKKEAEWRAARAEFEADFAQGADLERASREALDRAEAGAAAR